MKKLIVGLVLMLAASPLAFAQLRVKVEEEINEAELRALIVEQRRALHDEAQTIVAEYPAKLKKIPYGSPDRKPMVAEMANAKKFLARIPKEESLMAEIKDGKKKIPASWLKLSALKETFTVSKILDQQTFVGSKEKFITKGGGLGGIKTFRTGLNNYFILKGWETKGLKEDTVTPVQSWVIECRQVDWQGDSVPLFLRVPDSMIGK